MEKRKGKPLPKVKKLARPTPHVEISGRLVRSSVPSCQLKLADKPGLSIPELIDMLRHLMSQLRIGISGWRYKPWRGVFYPKGLAHSDELRHASHLFSSIEINGTFYSLQRAENFDAWRNQTPKNFSFAVKGSRFISHMKKLKEVETPLANFFASGLLLLKEKLGPILWQFPPNLKFSKEKFEEFFALLPRDTRSAANLAKRHDHRVKGEAVTRTDKNRRLRYAVEVRHPSFESPEFVKLLQKYNICLVFADTAGKWPYFEDLTSNFVYLRLHGPTELYASGYDDEALEWWARRIRAWRIGKQPRDAKCIGARKTSGKPRDAYIYFDNDAKVHAPFDAQALRRKLE